MSLDKFIFFSSRDEKHGAANQRPSDPLTSNAYAKSWPFRSPLGTGCQDNITVLKSGLNADRMVGTADGTADFSEDKK